MRLGGLRRAALVQMGVWWNLTGRPERTSGEATRATELS